MAFKKSKIKYINKYIVVQVVAFFIYNLPAQTPLRIVEIVQFVLPIVTNETQDLPVSTDLKERAVVVKKKKRSKIKDYKLKK